MLAPTLVLPRGDNSLVDVRGLHTPHCVVSQDRTCLWKAASGSIQISPSRGEGRREEARHPQTTVLLSLLVSFKSHQAKNSSFLLLPGQHGILITLASVSLLNPTRAPTLLASSWPSDLSALGTHQGFFSPWQEHPWRLLVSHVCIG